MQLVLSSWWHNRIPKDEVSEQETTRNTKERVKSRCHINIHHTKNE